MNQIFWYFVTKFIVTDFIIRRSLLLLNFKFWNFIFTSNFNSYGLCFQWMSNVIIIDGNSCQGLQEEETTENMFLCNIFPISLNYIHSRHDSKTSIKSQSINEYFNCADWNLF